MKNKSLACFLAAVTFTSVCPCPKSHAADDGVTGEKIVLRAKSCIPMIPKEFLESGQVELWDHLFGAAKKGHLTKYRTTGLVVPYLIPLGDQPTKFYNYNYGYTDDQLRKLQEIFEAHRNDVDLTNWRSYRSCPIVRRSYSYFGGDVEVVDPSEDYGYFSGYLKLMGDCADHIKAYLDKKVEEEK